MNILYRPAVAAVIASVVLASAGCSATIAQGKQGPTIDLLHSGWQHVPGVAQTTNSLRVTATGRSIVEQDGGGGQPDPPVNLMGSHLSVGNDFTITGSLTDVTDDATLAVYDAPPVIADEFRIETAGVRLTLHGHDLQISVFDGSNQKAGSSKPTRVEHARVANPEAKLTVHRSDDSLEVSSGNQKVSSLPYGEIFTSGALWMGLSSAHGSFTVNSLSASAPAGVPLATADPAVSAAKASPDGLQARAGRARPGFLVGAAVALGPLAADSEYAKNFVGNFGALTPENAMKPQALSPRRGEYTFAEADSLLDIAESKGIAVHGHTIAFSEAMPHWMRDLPADSEQDRQASAAALLDYLTTVVTHFRGRLHSLDVVNEPFGIDQGTDLQENVWLRVFGTDYPVIVSKAVHAADPNVEQFINENGADVPGPRQDALRDLATDTNKKGGYIYGVGLQAHVYNIDTDAISADDLATTFESFASAGLHVRISENDVDDSQGTHTQAKQYATIFKSCIQSEACVSYTTWGVDDLYDWWADSDGNIEQGHNFLFNEGKPTAAYASMIEFLT